MGSPSVTLCTFTPRSAADSDAGDCTRSSRVSSTESRDHPPNRRRTGLLVESISPGAANIFASCILIGIMAGRSLIVLNENSASSFVVKTSGPTNSYSLPMDSYVSSALVTHCATSRIQMGANFCFPPSISGTNGIFLMSDANLRNTLSSGPVIGAGFMIVIFSPSASFSISSPRCLVRSLLLGASSTAPSAEKCSTRSTPAS
mmetsp:Transcript_9285/g.25072  ORF Transcript_9285/g.25072 Transcript_9285/m.25072 type:complete len:203 (-) Transcript_9285:424-1032(-)